jgi:hypothetical protein
MRPALRHHEPSSLSASDLPKERLKVCWLDDRQIYGIRPFGRTSDAKVAHSTCTTGTATNRQHFCDGKRAGKGKVHPWGGDAKASGVGKILHSRERPIPGHRNDGARCLCDSRRCLVMAPISPDIKGVSPHLKLQTHSSTISSETTSPGQSSRLHLLHTSRNPLLKHLSRPSLWPSPLMKSLTALKSMSTCRWT